MAGKKRTKKKKNCCSFHLLMRLFNSECFYCGCDVEVFPAGTVPFPVNAATRDHYIPASLGGKNTVSNIVLACAECNSNKGDLKPNEFRQILLKTKKKSIEILEQEDLMRIKEISILRNTSKFYSQINIT